MFPNSFLFHTNHSSLWNAQIVIWMKTHLLLVPALSHTVVFVINYLYIKTLQFLYFCVLVILLFTAQMVECTPWVLVLTLTWRDMAQRYMNLTTFPTCWTSSFIIPILVYSLKTACESQTTFMPDSMQNLGHICTGKAV